VHSREAQEFLDSRENTVAGGTAWQRIAKLVDLSEKGSRTGNSTKTQFRLMLMSLQKDEKVKQFSAGNLPKRWLTLCQAPGASGL
jgi:hypothetical protein